MRLILLLFVQSLQALQVVAVPNGGNLQAALDTAVAYQNNTACEDYILNLEAGATFTTAINLDFRTSCNRYIRLRSSLLNNLVIDTRAGSSQAASMAKITLGNGASTLTTSDGAGYWALEGLEITTSVTVTSIVAIGSALEDTEAKLPHHFLIDRCWIHGNADANGPIRGILLNGRNHVITNSSITEVHYEGSDTQAIWCAQCLGPILVKNNLLSAAGENFMAGGGGCTIDGSFANASCIFIPGASQSFLTFIGNDFWKDPKWSHDIYNTGVPTRACLVGEYYQNQSGGQWYQCTVAGGTWITTSAPARTYTVKSLFELKDGRNVEVYGNTFRNSWYGPQSPNDNTLLLNQTGRCASSYNIQDIRFWGNLATNNISGLSLGNTSYIYPGMGVCPSTLATTQRVTLEHNIWAKHSPLSVARVMPNSYSLFFSVIGPTSTTDSTVGAGDIVFRHNTLYNDPSYGSSRLFGSAGELFPELYGNNSIQDNLLDTAVDQFFVYSSLSSSHCVWLYGVPRPGATATMNNNAVVGTLVTSGSCSQAPTYNGPTFPADTANAASITSMLTDPANGDYSVKGSFTAGLGTASDGRNLGADSILVAAVTANAITGTPNASLDFRLRGATPASTSVVIQYTAPSTGACTTLISASQTLSSPIGSPSQARVGKSGAATLSSGLTTHTQYYYSITCSSIELRGAFTTL